MPEAAASFREFGELGEFGEFAEPRYGLSHTRPRPGALAIGDVEAVSLPRRSPLS